MSSIQVNAAVVDNNTIVKTDVLRVEKTGKPVTFKAIKGAKYILAEGEKGFAPENITVKRVGKNLHVFLEGTDLDQPQLIIEDFFDKPGELVGKAEDGQWHEYISTDGDSDHEAAFLIDGESSALVLGAGSILGLDGLVVAPWALSPALMALGALGGLLAVAGLATAIGNHNGGGGGGGGDGGAGGGEGGGEGPNVKVPTLKEVIDDKGDFTGPIQNGGLTDDNTPTFRGEGGTPGNTIIVRDGGEIIGSTIVDADGNWEFTPEPPLTDGEHHFELVERDDKGNESLPGGEFVVIIDTDPPGRPAIDLVYDDLEPNVGPIADGAWTNDNTPTFSGSNAEPGDTIIIVDNGKEVGSTIVKADGSWEYTPDTGWAEGEHTVEVIARDPAGNRSEASDPHQVNIDTRIPGKPGFGDTPGIGDIIDDVGPIQGTIENGGVTDDQTPTLEGSFLTPGTIVHIIDNGVEIGTAIADKNGGWRFTPDTDLPDGDHNFTIIFDTPTGYTSEESDPWLVIVDTQAPDAPVISEIIDDQGSVTGPIKDGDTTDDAQPEIKGTAEANSTVIIYDNGVQIGTAQADANGDWSFIPVPPLLNGPHDITAKAQDKAGNISDPSNNIGFDLIAGGIPTAPAIIGAWDDVEGHVGMLDNGALTNDARPDFIGTAQPNSVVTITMDGKPLGTALSDANGQWRFTPDADISEGRHNFRAEVTDAAGNKTASGNFGLVIDTTAPADPTEAPGASDNVGPITGPINDGDTTDDSTPTFGGGGLVPGDIVIIVDKGEPIGSTIVDAGGNWEYTPENPLAEGDHSVGIIIEDPAGNRSDISPPIDFVVDTSDVIVSIDYVIDDAGPITGHLSSGKATDDTTPTLVGKAKPNSIVEIFDNGVSLGNVKANSFGNWTFTPDPELAEGHHRFTAVATDKTGSVSAPTAEFLLEIDITAPGKPGDGGTGGDGIGDIIDDVGPIQGSVKPGDETDDTTPTLEGSGLQPGDIVTIIDNGQPIGSAVADENGGWQFTPDTPLNDGEHDFTIIITDPVGNASEESDPYTIIIDTQAPDAPVIKSIIDDQGDVTGPINNGDTTDDAQPEISGTAEANSTVIIYDNGVKIGTAKADANGDWSFTPVPPLLNGPHDISAKAQDKAGNISEPSNNIGFDLVAGGIPTAPAITGAWDDVEGHVGMLDNGAVTNDARPDFIGTAQPNSVVTITMDGKPLGTALSDANGQWRFTPDADISEGRHNFRAEVTDAAGNKTASGNFGLIIDVTPPADPTEAPDANDNVGPITGPINDGDTTDDSTPTFGGGGLVPGDIVVIIDNGQPIGSTIVDPEGNWEYTPENPLEDGSHSVGIIIEDPAGNSSGESKPIEFVVDTSDVIVSIDYVIDDAGPITGHLSSGKATDDTTPTLVGKAKPNSTIEIFDNGVPLGTATADARGNWSFTPDPELGEGIHKFTAVATDKAGTVSAPTAEFVLEIDTTAPGKPGDGGTGGDGIGDIIDDVGPIQGSVKPGDETDDTTPTLEGSGLQPGDIVTIIDNGQPIGSAVADENGGWQFTPDTPLNDGEHDFTIIITDPVGNASEESDPYTIIIDTVAPDAPVIKSIIDDQGDVTGPINNGDTTDDAQPEISGTAEANSTVIIYDNGVKIGTAKADANGDWSFTPVPPLLNGPHDISAKAQDKAGNISEPSNSIGFDLVAGGIPTAPAITGAWDDVEGHVGMLDNGALTNDARPELIGTAQPNSVVTITMDGKPLGTALSDANGQWRFTPDADISEGRHNFRAEVTDAAGNKTASGNFGLIIDVTPPADPTEAPDANDNVGPITGPINDGDTTDDSTPTFGGGGLVPGDIVVIIDNGEPIGSTIVDPEGNWEYTPENPLEDGSHSVGIIIEDPAGNSSGESKPIEFVVDTSDVIVSIDYVIDDAGPITGHLSSGKATDDTTPTLVGKAKPNSTIEIFDNGVPLGTATADARGNWSFTPDPELGEGTHKFTAVATDKAGTVSAPTAEFVLEIDTTAPGKPGDGGTGGDGIGDIIDDVGPIQGSVKPGGETDDTTPTLEGSGLQPGDVVTIIDNGDIIGSAKVDENGGWQFTPDTPLNDGEHDFTIIITDPVGNASEESDPYTIIIDTVAPDAPVIKSIIDDQGDVTGPINNGDTTDDAQPEISGTAEANSTVIIYDNGVKIGTAKADANGDWSFTPVPPLLNGPHDISAKAQDKAGNISEPSNNIGFDLIAGGTPTAPAITGAWDDVEGHVGMLDNGALTNDARPELIGTAQPNSVVTIMMDGKPLGTALSDANGQWRFTPAADIAEGRHSFRAEVTDAAGNITASGNFRLEIDVTPPADPTTAPGAEDNVGPITGPIKDGDTTDDSTPTFGGGGLVPGDTVVIIDNGQPIGSTIVDAGGNWEFTPENPLPDGEHSVGIIIEDPAGNSSDISPPIDFVVDTSDVIVSIDYVIDDAGPITGHLSSGKATDDTTPTLVGKAKPNSIVEIFDGTQSLGTAKADARGNWSFTPDPELKEGLHSFTAVATDTAGTVSAPTAEFVLEIDTTAPGKPGTPGNGDGIGDIIDDVGPIQGSVKPGEETDDTTPTLEGSGLQPGDIVTIIDNGQEIGSAVADENGGWQFTPDTPLNDGAHDFTIIVTDPVGNASEESDPYTIIIDTKAPNAPVITEIIDDQGSVTGPINNGDTTDDAQPEIRGTAEANSTVTVYDGSKALGTAKVDASGNWSFIPVPPLTNGPHDISAKAQDRAGNISDPSNHMDFIVHAGGVPTAPAITNVIDDFGIITGNISPGGSTDDQTPTIVGTAPAGSIVTIEINGNVMGSVKADPNGQWSFESPFLTPGVQAIVAKAVDAKGNVLPQSGEYAINIDITPPALGSALLLDDVGDKQGLIRSGDTTDDSTPTFEGFGEAGATVIIYDNGLPIGSTTVNPTGSWTFTPTTPLEDGEHSFNYRMQDPVGNQSGLSTPVNFTLDTSGVAVNIDYAIDDEGTVTGRMASGAVTDDTTPTLVGRTIPNAVVEIRDGNNVLLGTAVADARGNWQFTTPVLTEGAHSLTATVTNAAGNKVTSGKFDLVIDITPPDNKGIGLIVDDVGAVTGPIADGEATDDSTPTLIGSGQVPGDVVTIIDNGQPIGSAVVDNNGDWKFTPETPLNDGEHDFTIIVTDPVGNSSEESPGHKVIVETRPPVTPVITEIWDDEGDKVGRIMPGDTTDDAQPEVRGTGTPGNIIVIYDGGVPIGTASVIADGTWSFTPDRPMANGPHSITAAERSLAGNTSAPTASWNFNISANTLPGTPAITDVIDDHGPYQGSIAKGGITDDNTPTVKGTGNPGNVVYIYDGENSTIPVASVTVKADGTWTVDLPVLADGTHDLWANAKDAVGNESPKTGLYPITIDTDAPTGISGDTLLDDVGAITGPISDGDTTDDSTPTWRGKAEPGATVIIKDNGVEIGTALVDANGDWEFIPVPPLADGDHSFSAIVRDPAGNDSPESTPIKFVVDTSDVEVTLDYAIDDKGMYTGNLSNGSATDDDTPTLVGKATPDSVVNIYQNGVQIGTANAGPDGNWRYNVPSLAEGTYQFQASVIDAGGNESAKTSDFVLEINLTAPGKPAIDQVFDDVGSIQGPVSNGGYTDDSTPTLSGKGKPGETAVIRDKGVIIGSGVVDANGNWRITPTTPLRDGLHEFTVELIDKVGNTSVRSDAWSVNVDTVAPLNTQISYAVDDFGKKTGNLGSGSQTDDKTPDLVGKAEAGSKVTLEYNDGSGWKVAVVTTADTQGNWVWNPPSELAYGNYQFRAYAEDEAGNRSSYSTNFSLKIGPDMVIEEFIQNVVSSGTFVNSGLVLSRIVAGQYAEIGYTNFNSWPKTSGREAKGFFVGGSTTRLTIPGGAEELSYELSGQWRGSVRYYAANGELLGTAPISSGLKSFVAPAGKSVAYMDVAIGQTYPYSYMNIVWGATFSYLQWGEKGSGAANGRVGEEVDPNAGTFGIMETGDTIWGLDADGNLIEVHLSTEQRAELDARMAADEAQDAATDEQSAATVDTTAAPATPEDANANAQPEPEPAPEVNTDVGINSVAALADEKVTSTYDQEVKTLTLTHAEEVLDFKQIVTDSMDVTVVDMTNDELNVLNISLGDVLAHGEENAFVTDGSKQLLIKGDAGDVVNLSDLLPDGSDAGDWAKAEGTVTVSGVQYEVYQHSGADTDLLVQLGVQTNLNNH